MGGAPRGHVGDVLDMPAIGLDAAKAHPRGGGDQLRQRQRRSGCHPGAMLAKIDIDKQCQPRAGRRRHLCRRIDHGGHRRPARQRRQPRPAPARHRRGDQHIADTARDISFRLAHRLTAQADRAAGDLQPAQRAALVHLAMRPQPHPGGITGALQRREIGAERGAPDDQRRGLRRADPAEKIGEHLHRATLCRRPGCGQGR